MIAAASLDWGVIINAISLGIVMILTAWMKLKMQQATSSRERMEKTLNKVQKNTDGAITAAMLVAATATKKIALKSGDPEDIEIARIAQEAYQTQKAVQKESEHLPKPEPHNEP